MKLNQSKATLATRFIASRTCFLTETTLILIVVVCLDITTKNCFKFFLMPFAVGGTCWLERAGARRRSSALESKRHGRWPPCGSSFAKARRGRPWRRAALPRHRWDRGDMASGRFTARSDLLRIPSGANRQRSGTAQAGPSLSLPGCHEVAQTVPSEHARAWCACVGLKLGESEQMQG